MSTWLQTVVNINNIEVTYWTLWISEETFPCRIMQCHNVNAVRCIMYASCVHPILIPIL